MKPTASILTVWIQAGPDIRGFHERTGRTKTHSVGKTGQHRRTPRQPDAGGGSTAGRRCTPRRYKRYKVIVSLRPLAESRRAAIARRPSPRLDLALGRAAENPARSFARRLRHALRATRGRRRHHAIHRPRRSPAIPRRRPPPAAGIDWVAHFRKSPGNIRQSKSNCSFRRSNRDGPGGDAIVQLPRRVLSGFRHVAART